MSLRQTVIKHYQDAVKVAKVPDELKRSLKTNERLPVFIDNLVVQIGMAPKNYKPEVVQYVVHQMTGQFLTNVHRKAEEARMSDLAKSTIRQNHAEFLNVEEAEDQSDGD